MLVNSRFNWQQNISAKPNNILMIEAFVEFEFVCNHHGTLLTLFSSGYSDSGRIRAANKRKQQGRAKEHPIEGNRVKSPKDLSLNGK